MIQLLVICILMSQALGSPELFCGQTFRFARYYGSNMVLQRAPAQPNVWGYAINIGDNVKLKLTNENTGDFTEYTTTATAGISGLPVWSVSLDPQVAGGTYTIKVNSGDCKLSLSNILFGDVWFCSGQSNMGFLLQYINEPQQVIEKSVNYPDIRTFTSQRSFSSTPQEDLAGVSIPWSVPDPGYIGNFSAVCYLFATHLYDKYQHPIGLIESDWFGTRIEAWSSPDSLEVCFPDEPAPGIDQNNASVLYNSLVHPFFPLPIFGSIWYQGEQNVGNAADYGCAIREMVKDWRSMWFSKTNTMDPQFPFGEVQLAPYRDNDTITTGFPDIRWQQTFQYAYVPNNELQRYFMAVATDLPDFTSPHGAIHPRYKRQIAERLSYGAFVVAYDDTSSGRHQGPVPTNIVAETNENIVLTFGDVTGTLVQRGDPSTQHGYEVCCSMDPSLYCGENSAVNTRWKESQIISASTGTIVITNPCAVAESATGLRYTWRESPCKVLEECPIYADAAGNNLPAPPFIYYGLIHSAKSSNPVYIWSISLLCMTSIGIIVYKYIN